MKSEKLLRYGLHPKKCGAVTAYLIHNSELQASLQEVNSPGVSWEVRCNGQKPLLHLWSEQVNPARRVLPVTDHSEHRLAVAVRRFGRAKPDRLEFMRREFRRDACEL